MIGDSREYDRIGIGYGLRRLPDPRLRAAIEEAIGRAATVLNVGAGAGSYEPPDRIVVALEPSAVMLVQHPGQRPVQGAAEHLPFRDGGVLLGIEAPRRYADSDHRC